MTDENDKVIIQGMIDKTVKKAMDYPTRKLGDTPTDDLQLTPKKYVDAQISSVSGGGGTPGGSDTQVQFNDGGAFNGDTAFTFNKTTNVLTIEDIQGVSAVAMTIGSRNAANSTASGMALTISSGNGGGTSGDGGNLTIKSGNTNDPGNVAGTILVQAGANSGSDGDNGNVRFMAAYDEEGEFEGYIEIVNGQSGAWARRKASNTQTTDGSAADRWLFTTATDTSYMVEVRAVARRTSGSSGTAGDSAGYVRRATYKNISGTVTLVGAVQDDYTAEDQAGWDATLVISTTKIMLRVTGAANNTVQWDWEVTYIASPTG